MSRFGADNITGAPFDIILRSLIGNLAKQIQTIKLRIVKSPRGDARGKASLVVHNNLSWQQIKLMSLDLDVDNKIIPKKIKKSKEKNDCCTANPLQVACKCQ